MATFDYLKFFIFTDYVRIVAFAPDSQRASFYSRMLSPRYSTTVGLIPFHTTYKYLYLSLRDLQRYWEIIISFVFTMAHKFTQDHPAS